MATANWETNPIGLATANWVLIILVYANWDTNPIVIAKWTVIFQLFNHKDFLFVFPELIEKLARAQT